MREGTPPVAVCQIRRVSAGAPSPPPGLSLVPRDGWRPLPQLRGRGGVKVECGALRMIAKPPAKARHLSPEVGGEAGRGGGLRAQFDARRSVSTPDAPAVRVRD